MVRSIALLVASLLGAVPAAAEPDAKAEFDRGTELFEQKDYRAALPHFERAVELSNRRPSAIRALAQCEWLLKRYDQAIAHFREYLETGPSDAANIEVTISQIEREREEAQRAAPPPPVPPSDKPAVKPPVSKSSAVEASTADEGGTIFSSPAFWIITGVVVAAVVTSVIVVAASSEPDPFEEFQFMSGPPFGAGFRF